MNDQPVEQLPTTRLEILGAIILWAFVGLVLAGSTLVGYACYCKEPTSAVCSGAPPWTLISGIVAAPPLILTWYWRTRQKRLDQQRVDAANRNAARANETSKQKLEQERERSQRDFEFALKRLDQEKLNALRSQLPGRFAEAAKMLGSDAIWARLGGIYALEQLATDADEQYGRIVVETLVALIRAKRLDFDYANDTGPYLDSTAAMVVLARRETEEASASRLELQHVDLNGIDLSGPFKRGGANLSRANLAHVNFFRANLAHADFELATLSFSTLTQANLRAANLKGADLTGASVTVEQLREADNWHLAILPADVANEMWSTAADQVKRWTEVTIYERFKEIRETLGDLVLQDLDQMLGDACEQMIES